MISVSILGYGNVAWHLVKVFDTLPSIKLVQVYTRNQINNKDFNAPHITDLSHLLPAQIFIIAIPDDAISDFSKQLDFKESLVVHTSGSVAIDALKCSSHKGVFYPLQSFSKNKPVTFSKVPIAIEADNKTNLNLLKKLANNLSPQVYKIDSHQRKKIHVAAVFVNNFVNYLYSIGEDLCQSNNIDFSILKPLILETALKVKNLSSKEAQTGPAKRFDTKTIENHLNILPKEYQEIYTLLTNSIQKNVKKL